MIARCLRIALLVLCLIAPAALAQALAQDGKKSEAAKSPTPAAAKGTEAGKSPVKSTEPRSPSEEVPPPATAAAKNQEPAPPAAEARSPSSGRGTSLEVRHVLLISGISIFVLSVFVGFEVISKVPATLHTPLMSGSNAISGITVVGAIIAAAAGWGLSSFLGFFAVILAMINVVGGFLVTHRMLLMFKRK